VLYKRKITQAVKITPHINGKGATLLPGTVKLLTKEQEQEKD
jgi:hypothetical protein